VTYGQPFHTGNVTAIRHLDQHQNGEFLEFLVAGKSQGKLRMPADLPRDAVGCIGACNGQGGGISAIAPASFQVGQHGPGVSLHNGRGGGSNSTAVWSAGLGSCNQIAFLTPDTRQVGTVQFTVSLGTGVGSFIDIGWCSPSLDPTGKTYKPGPKPSEWMGEQGPGKCWIYREQGLFKASTSVPPPCHTYHDRKSGLAEICLCFAMPILTLMQRSR
jgi:hypothetical protein